MLQYPDINLLDAEGVSDCTSNVVEASTHHAAKASLDRRNPLS